MKSSGKIVNVGIVLFFILYFLAALKYPGGNQNNLNSEGFNWIHNYWCNLTDSVAMNGESNPSKPIAIVAMIFLCIALSFFFYRFSKVLAVSKFETIVIKYSGILSMISASLIFTNFHHTMILIASLLGGIALLSMFICLFRMNWRIHNIIASTSILLILGNNLIYYSSYLLWILPLLQKITFAFVLIWFLKLNRDMDNIKKVI